MQLIVTRPQAQGEDFVQRLRALGVQALALPLIEIAPAHEQEPLRAAWAELPACALAMFVSANAVAHFFAARPPRQAWPATTLAGSSGPGTSAALRAAGVPAAQIVDPGAHGPFDTDTLWLRRLADMPWSARRVLLVRGEGGRDWLATRLQKAGARVDALVAYRRLRPTLAAPQRALLAAAQAAPGDHVWHFGSGEAVANLAQLAGAADWSRASALATHARIAQRARELGFARVEEIGLHAQEVAAWMTSAQAAAPGR